MGNIFDPNYYNYPVALVARRFVSLSRLGLQWVGSINDRGQLSGQVADPSVPDSSVPAISRLGGGLVRLNLPEGRVFASIGKVNNSGSITGVTFDPATSTFRGHVWRNPRNRIDLGEGVYPSAINDSGTVIGERYQDSDLAPFVWDSEGGIRDLRDSLAPSLRGRVLIHSANSINRSGEILIDYSTIEQPGSRQSGILYRRGSPFPCALR